MRIVAAQSDGSAVLGVDLGTSQVKAMVCARDGTVLGRGAAGYPVHSAEQGQAESDPEQWWAATSTAIRAAMMAAARPVRPRITAMAVAGQMHGLVLCSAGSRALRPAITWLDRRAHAEVDDYQRLPASLLGRLANRPSPGMAGPILLWLARHEPSAYSSARWALQPKDWLRLRLTGQAATDPTDASATLLFDLAAGTWATDVMAALGLRAGLLPPVRPPAEIAGTLLAGPAEQLGLTPGLPVAVGAADTAASLLGAGQVKGAGQGISNGKTGIGLGLVTLGTGGQLIVRGLAGQDPDGQVNVFGAVDGGSYWLAAVQNVGVALDWARRTLGASWDELYAVAGRPWRADTPVFVPYLAGERWDDHGAAGAWAGLTLGHQREDLMRAALEGVAFGLRGRLEVLRALGADPPGLIIAGGGSRDPAWRRLLAEILQTPLYPAAEPALTVRGAALIAAVASGLFASWAQAAGSAPPPGPAVHADPGAQAQAAYLRFLEITARIGTIDMPEPWPGQPGYGAIS